MGDNQRIRNLNTVEIPASGAAGTPLEDPRTISRGGVVYAYFRDIERELIRHIREAQCVVGCVAWLTSTPVLSALAACHSVSLVVQKEDFLRPDQGVTDVPAFKASLHDAYKALPRGVTYGDFEPLLRQLSGSLSEIDPVRVMGVANRKKVTTPRMHHKFAVFCRGGGGWHGEEFVPYAVWTGSFNWTENATQSLENAVVIYDEHVAHAYFHEWQQVLALSEPLDWSQEWVAPEWWIGT